MPKKEVPKEQPLEKLTHGKLEEVEKDPVKKALWEEWLEKRHLPLWEKIVNKQTKQDGTITNMKLLEIFGNNQAALDSAKAFEKRKRTVNPNKGKVNDGLAPSMRNFLDKLKKANEIIKVSMGDPNKANPHETGSSDDSQGGIIDDKQIYIGKPSSQGKGKEND